MSTSVPLQRCMRRTTVAAKPGLTGRLYRASRASSAVSQEWRHRAPTATSSNLWSAAAARPFSTTRSFRFADVDDNFDPKSIDRESDDVDVCIIGGGMSTQSSSCPFSHAFHLLISCLSPNRSRWTQRSHSYQATGERGWKRRLPSTPSGEGWRNRCSHSIRSRHTT